MTVPQVFLIGLLNLWWRLHLPVVPEYLLRFIAWIATRLVYRFEVRGDEHIPTEGAAILVCNHVSFVDAILLMAASPRPIVFIMDHRIFKLPVLGTLFRLRQGRADRAAEGRSAGLRAGLRAREGGARRRATCWHLPEGAITRDGTLGEFRAA